jgi:NAD(P)-dependent dehydrogenase (short-subunit alcohol dehydrogenase family)
VRALILLADVARYEEVDAAAAQVEAQLGPIDVWVNNSMATVFTPSWDCHPDDFRRAVEVTFLRQVWRTMAALERMRPRDRGNHRERRVSPVFRRNTTAIRLLFVEVRASWVLRIDAR